MRRPLRYRRKHPPAHPVVAAQILPGEHRSEPPCFQQLPHGGALIVAVLQQQPAAGFQPARCSVDQYTQVIQPVRAGRQCLRRLEAQVAFAQVMIAAGNVGRVGDDQIEAV